MAPGMPGSAPIAHVDANREDTSWRETYFWPLLVLLLAIVAFILYRVFRRSPAPIIQEPPPLDVDFDLDLDRPPRAGEAGPDAPDTMPHSDTPLAPRI